MKNKVSKKTGKKTGKRKVFTKKRRRYRGGDMNGILLYRDEYNTYYFNGKEEISDDMKLHGEGTLSVVSDDGDWIRYNGIWNDSKLTQGTIREKEGRILYKGELITHNNNKYFINPHGFGTMTYGDGDTYTGNWVDGKQNGQGEYLYYETGDTYNGNWLHGERNGQGEYLFYENSVSFQGTWADDICTHGHCIYPGGTESRCTFQDAKNWIRPRMDSNESVNTINGI
jgi:hypothetical protein